MAKVRANFTISVQGADRLVATARRKGGEIKTAANRVIRKYTLLVERSAKRRAPVDTGRLRSSIRHNLEELAGEVLTDVHYAKYQEFGTGRRGAQAGIETPEGYDYGMSPGISPNSFLRPALEEHAKSFINELKVAVRAVL